MNDLALEFSRLDILLAEAVKRFRVNRAQSDDVFGGLYINDEEADASLVPANADPAADLPQPSFGPLAELTSLLQLTPFERDVLLLAAAPEFEHRYQTLYGYLQNDATKRHPTVEFAIRLFSCDREERWKRLRYFEDNRDLLAGRLIRFVEDPHDRDPALPGRMFRLAPRVAALLSGRKAADPQIAGWARIVTPRTDLRDLGFPPELQTKLLNIADAAADGGLIHLRGHTPEGRRCVAEAVCRRLNRKLIVYEPGSTPLAEHAAILRRECRLLSAGLFVTASNQAFAHELANAPFPVVLADAPAGEGEGDSAHGWDFVRTFHVELEAPGIAERLSVWRTSMNGSCSAGIEAGIPALAGKFCFDAGQIRSVVAEAANLALARGAPRPELSDLNDAARAHSSDDLRRLARKVTARFTWDDLILPTRIKRQLREIVDAVRFRHTVSAVWRFEEKTGSNSGLSVMFSGASGAGKTMAASIIARELNLDIYRIDLSSVVSKYIGETEKNLNRIFAAAQSAGAILFFDEADAIFGKRSEVKDAHDRYANIEVAYLLQKMEEFSGLAILATNFGRNLDTAFQRRLQHAIEFPLPDAADRETIWRNMFPKAAPRDEQIDFAFLARQFEFSGGNIRNAVVAAAYLAAADERPIAMDHLIQATGREYQKMGRLPSRGDFREHFDSIRERV